MLVSIRGAGSGETQDLHWHGSLRMGSFATLGGRALTLPAPAGCSEAWSSTVGPPVAQSHWLGAGRPGGPQCWAMPHCSPLARAASEHVRPPWQNCPCTRNHDSGGLAFRRSRHPGWRQAPSLRPHDRGEFIPDFWARGRHLSDLDCVRRGHPRRSASHPVQRGSQTKTTFTWEFFVLTC